MCKRKLISKIRLFFRLTHQLEAYQKAATRPQCAVPAQTASLQPSTHQESEHPQWFDGCHAVRQATQI